MPYQSYELLKKVKRTDLIPLIDDYYNSIGRVNKPDFHLYSLQELKLCMIDFGIEIKIENEKSSNKVNDKPNITNDSIDDK